MMHRSFFVCVLVMVVPYIVVTYHMTRVRDEPQLDAYYATIASAQKVLDSLNKTEDLVIGLSQGIPTTNLAIFAGSLRAYSKARLVIFIDSVDDELRSLARARRIEFVKFGAQRYHPSSFRWPLIYEYLSAHRFRGVLMADVRDTAFQSDPFALLDGTFQAYHGVESRTIGECGWNGGWIRDCFGDKKLRALAQKPIICSGVSLGDYDVALQYAKQMSAIISHKDFANCERNGVDQGVHNVLIHEGRVKARVISQRDSLVANLQARVALVKGDKVVRAKDNKQVAVVHQYDRFPDLAKYYVDKYAPQTSNHCANYDIQPNVDLFKGKCDLTVTTGAANSDCCKACNSNSKCKAWTLAGSLCYLKVCDKAVTNVRMQGAVSAFKKLR